MSSQNSQSGGEMEKENPEMEPRQFPYSMVGGKKM